MLLKNKTLNGDELLVFLFSIVERGIGMTVKTKVNDEKAMRDYGAKVDNLFTKQSASKLMEQSHGIQMEWVKTSQQVSKKKTEEPAAEEPAAEEPAAEAPAAEKKPAPKKKRTPRKKKEPVAEEAPVEAAEDEVFLRGVRHRPPS